MRRIYIAGPYTSERGVEGEDENIKIAAQVAYEYLVNGWAVFCPHTMTCQIDRDFNRVIKPDGHPLLSWEDYLVHDLNWISQCHAIHMLPNWRSSKGAVVEYMTAKALGLEILGEAS